jgi:histidinol-phosphate aminotransferase
MSLEDKVKQLIRPCIQALTSYHVPESDNLIKLDAMENPWSWPEALVDAWLERLRGIALNRYPNPGAGALKLALRKSMSIPADAEVLLGNGSDELIQMIIQSVAEPGRVVMTPEPTFVMYRQLAAVAGLEYHPVSLDGEFNLDAKVMLSVIEATDPAVIFIAYPNNPTGNLFDRTVVDAVLETARGLVVIDEAYAPFTDRSYLDDVMNRSNLLVLRTLSKMGLAGLRLGILAGHPDWLGEIDKTRLPYNISTLNQVSGEFALAHQDIFDKQARLIRQARGELLGQLKALDLLTVFPSDANFILFRVPAGQADTVFNRLKTAGVLIKNLDGSAETLADCLRVTVGQPEENAAFLEALEQALK